MISEILEHSDRKIILSPSEDFTFYLQRKLYDKYDVHPDYRMTIQTDAVFKDISSRTVVPPLEGEFWALNIRYDSKKMGFKFIENFLKFQSDYAFAILWVDNYRDFAAIMAMPTVNRDTFLQIGKFSYLRIEDARQFYQDNIVYKEFEPPEDVVKYLIQNYRFDIAALANTIALINGGRELRTTKELIQVAGLGNTSTDNLMFKLLKSSTKTKSGITKLYAECLVYVEHLNTKLEHRTIINYLISSLNTLMDIKQLQIRGIYKNYEAELPPIYDQQKMLRYNRYERDITERISLIDIMNLKLAFEKSYNRDASIHIMNALSNYMDYLYSRGGGDRGEEERKAERKRKAEERKQRNLEMKELAEAQSFAQSKL